MQFSIHLSQIVFILREINGMNEFRSDINDLENVSLIASFTSSVVKVCSNH